MRILTVRQPWAWAIIHGGKDVENRVRNIAGDYRGPVAIHVALRDDDDAFEQEHPMHGLIFAPCPNRASVDHNRHHCHWCTQTAPSKYGYKGCIIGVVDLVDVHTADDTEQTKNLRGLWPTCSPWAERIGYHLVLANPRPLAEPIPYRGALGLRKTEFEIINDWLVAPWGHPDRPCTPYGCEPGCEYEPVAQLKAVTK